MPWVVFYHSTNYNSAKECAMAYSSLHPDKVFGNDEYCLEVGDGTLPGTYAYILHKYVPWEVYVDDGISPTDSRTGLRHPSK